MTSNVLVIGDIYIVHRLDQRLFHHAPGLVHLCPDFAWPYGWFCDLSANLPFLHCSTIKLLHRFVYKIARCFVA